MEAEYRRLKSAWQSGLYSREEALHLLYFAWYHWADPQFVTGLEYDPDANELWLEIFHSFGGEQSKDAEFLYVASLMAGLFPECLGDVSEWTARAERMEARYSRLRPEGFSQEHFDGRGDYGEYFANHARARQARPIGRDLHSSGLRGWVINVAQRLFGLTRPVSS
ncbi:hypothetical protein [Brevundimonas sp. TWP1-2-1b1]|uniref:hypothetical protein n=1 Tax=unclassified Brevundimonas TaxID=2622653 RepID=UPI003CEF4D2E